MDQETFNLSIRKFLKMVGVNSQREIEQAVQKALDRAKIEPTEAELIRIPTLTKKVDPDTARKVLALLDKIEEFQDVQSVYSTLEYDDETVAARS